MYDCFFIGVVASMVMMTIAGAGLIALWVLKEHGLWALLSLNEDEAQEAYERSVLVRLLLTPMEMIGAIVLMARDGIEVVKRMRHMQGNPELKKRYDRRKAYRKSKMR